MLVIPVKGLAQWFWSDAAADEPQEINDSQSEGTCSRAHSVSRSIECADMVVIADRQEPDSTLREAIRLIRALNPTASIVDQSLEPLATQGQILPEAEDSSQEESYGSISLKWATADDRFARVRVQASRPLNPKRFLRFVKEGWPAVIRGRGEVRIASQPGTYRLWSQAGKVGVLGSRNVSTRGGWRQDLTLIGTPQACMNACRNFEESLLTDEEIELGSRLWRFFVDPFKE
jgi:G3E family GTPase